MGPLRRGLGFPDWFWEKIREESRQTFKIASFVGVVGVALALIADLTAAPPHRVTAAIALRSIAIAYFVVIGFVAVLRPDLAKRFYSWWVAGIWLGAALPPTIISAWLPPENLYFLAVFEAEFAIFAFLQTRFRFWLPALVISNLGYLYIATEFSGLEPGSVFFANLAVSFAIVALLVVVVQYAILKTKYALHLSLRKLRVRSDELEHEVRERTMKLARSEARYRTVVESTFDTLFEIDPADCSLRIPADMDGGKLDAAAIFTEGVEADHREAFRSMLRDCVKNEKPYEMQLPVVYEGGERRIYQTACKPFRMGGSTAGILVASDITEERRLAEEVERQGRLAAVGQLAAGIAHDFNNILQTIAGAAELVSRSENMTQEDRQNLLRIVLSADRGGRVVKKMLDFSGRSPSGSESSVNLSDFLEDTVMFLRKAFPHPIEVSLEKPDKPVWVRAESSQLEQVLLNLAGNAADAMPDGGRLSLGLRIGYSDGNASAILTVSDTGCGIDEETKRRIFEPFFSTKAEKGTGLGLSQVYGLVTQMGGQIKVDSTVGQGTTFTISLRLTQPSDEKHTGQSKESDEAGIEGMRVLVVEDEPDLRHLFGQMLATLGVEWKTAKNAQEALSILQDGAEFDAILTDQSMPDMTGDELARVLERNGSKTPRILMTGLLKLSGEALRPFAAVLQKPFELLELRDTIARVRNTGDS